LQFFDGISARLKLVRSTLGLTQKQISDKIGAKTPSWKDNEAGKTIPGGKVLAGLSRLGVNINWVLTDDGEMMIGDGSHAPLPGDEHAVPVVLDAQLLGQIMVIFMDAARQQDVEIPPSELGGIAATAYEDVINNFTPDSREKATKLLAGTAKWLARMYKDYPPKA